MTPTATASRPTIAPAPRPQGPRPQYLELRANVHRKLLNRLNLEALAQTDRSRAEGEIRALLSQLLTEESTPINLSERETLFAEILDDVFGLGPLEPLLRDPSINDILVNTYKQVFVERKGVLERVSATFQDDKHLLRVIDRIVSSVGRRIDDSSPMVDARLLDGSRVNAIIPPLAVDGPLLSIRRFPAERLQADDLVNLRALTAPMLNFMGACVKGRLNCLISGGTGAGKTTLLNVLSSYISEHERVVTIEDAAELQLRQEHVARLETRPANVEGKGAVKQRQLVVNALRDQPAGTRDAAADFVGDQHRDAADAAQRWVAARDERLRNHRDGRRHHHDAGHLHFRKDRSDGRRQGDRALPGDRRAAEVLGAAEGRGHQPAA